MRDKPKYLPGELTQSQLEEIQKKIEHTNVFPLALERAGFKQLDEITHVKGENEKIRIFHKDGKWRYQNLKNIVDTGSVIDFINKRLVVMGGGKQQEKWNYDFAAIAALDYYHIHLKEEKKKASITAAKELDKKMQDVAQSSKQAKRKVNKQ